MFKRWKNKHHPEKLPGEVFLTNADSDTLDYHIGWKTKRKGKTAYDIYNKPLNYHDFFPVFVQRNELLAGGIDPDNLWGEKTNLRKVVLVIGIVLILVTIAVFVR